MACEACLSENQQNFSGELTVAFPGVQRLNQFPSTPARTHWFAWTAGIQNLSFPQLN